MNYQKFIPIPYDDKNSLDENCSENMIAIDIHNTDILKNNPKQIIGLVVPFPTNNPTDPINYYQIIKYGKETCTCEFIQTEFRETCCVSQQVVEFQTHQIKTLVQFLKWRKNMFLNSNIDQYVRLQDCYQYLPDEEGWRTLPGGKKIKLGNNCESGNKTKIYQNCKFKDGCKIGDNCSVGEDCFFEKNVCIDNNCIVGENCFFEKNVCIGNNCKISPHVDVDSNCHIEDSVVLCEGSEIGSYVHIGKKTRIGSYSAIYDSVVIGSYVNIHSCCGIGLKGCGAVIFDNTTLKRGSRIK